MKNSHNHIFALLLLMGGSLINIFGGYVGDDGITIENVTKFDKILLMGGSLIFIVGTILYFMLSYLILKNERNKE